MNMNNLLAVARENRFAVPAFNISSNMLLSGVMEAAEEAAAPVIIAIHPDELAFVRPAFVKMAIAEAIQVGVPVCIHLDHGMNMKQIMVAIQSGFTSVMMDASTQPLEQNIEKTRAVVELPHTINVSVEGELGTTGTIDDEAEAGTSEIFLVKLEDVNALVN